MSMPSILRKRIQRDSYSVSPVKGFMRTEMEVGPARQRRIASAMPTDLTFNLMLLSRNELAVFETWYKFVLNNGAAWFRMPVDCGSGMVETDVRFTDTYSVSPQGSGVWEVQCKAECREMPVMSVAEMEAYLV